MASTTQINEGTQIITVARDGSRTAKSGRFSIPIYTTAIYTAMCGRRDGVMTWRRTGSVGHHSTSGRVISGAMLTRAREYAATTGREFLAGVRHGHRV